MSTFAALGALETGLIYALVALGVYLSFRVLDFPDLTVDGSFPLGAAVTAALITSGVDPWISMLAAMIAGAAAGAVTAFLNVRLGILHLLASILTMIALYSINQRVMGAPNVALFSEATALTPLEALPLPAFQSKPLAFLVAIAVIAIGLNWFLRTETGLAMRAIGANPRMARAQGARVGLLIGMGMALSNALVALGGSLFAQSQGFADVTLGVGTIVVGLAAVIVGEAILPPKRIWIALLACIIGSIIYRFAIQLALSADWLGLEAQDLNLATAILIVLAMSAPSVRAKLGARRRGPAR
ncbi:MAG: ABC transporter permease [Pseudomonadota bacterium]